jgi:outer membrane protein assembly factor BamE (lipoprotein component of BamABCDE complex)
MSRIQDIHQLTANPGKGTERIQLGCSQQDVRRALGKPDTTQTYSDEIWWSFFDAGIDCGFSRASKILLAINFFRDGIAGHREAQVTTREGLGPGVSKLIVTQRLGKPDESDMGWTDQQGVWHRSWMKYHSGIAFEFGHDGRADVMTIYQPDGAAVQVV